MQLEKVDKQRRKKVYKKEKQNVGMKRVKMAQTTENLFKWKQKQTTKWIEICQKEEKEMWWKFKKKTKLNLQWKRQNLKQTKEKINEK